MLRTPAPLIGALGLSLKRALALLAESIFGSRCNGCSLFSRMLEGRRRDRAVITACVFALLSDLTRALLVSASMAALKSRIALPCVPSGPDKNVGLCHSSFQRALASEVRLRACVFALPSGSTRALPMLRSGVVPSLR